jgi:uncharacterized protein (TIGR03435 family)
MREGFKGAVAFLIVAAAGGLIAQPPASRPVFDAFEVATVKPTAPDWTGGRYMRMQTAHQFEARGYQLRVLLAAAYNLTPKAISGGPAWIDSDLYDILAETPGEVRPTLEEQMSMLRKLLAERFNLRFHREEKEFAIYALTVAKGGPKLKESAPVASPEGAPPLVFRLVPDRARLPARDATMAELAWVMQRAAISSWSGRPTKHSSEGMYRRGIRSLRSRICLRRCNSSSG